MKDESATTVLSLGEVVATYKSRPQKSAAEYSAEIAQIAQYYGAGIMKEPEIFVTEDAEVVSIETAAKDHTSNLQ